MQRMVRGWVKSHPDHATGSDAASPCAPAAAKSTRRSNESQAGRPGTPFSQSRLSEGPLCWASPLRLVRPLVSIVLVRAAAVPSNGGPGVLPPRGLPAQPAEGLQETNHEGHLEALYRTPVLDSLPGMSEWKPEPNSSVQLTIRHCSPPGCCNVQAPNANPHPHPPTPLAPRHVHT